MHLFRKRLGEMLLEDGVISGEDLESALECAKRRLVPVGRALLELGRVDEALLSIYLERQLGESLV
ncbi:MAG: MSHA biogenesis protein MshE, partial [Candidatus Eisenbacteria bacterium]|nr:MSHA biogenesis protein MshE [Candidatus Eisenbacteria bacterium]